MINLDHPGVLDLFTDLREKGRADSAAYLIWYLENYFRVSRDEAIDCVGDKPGDQGVDGIWINDPAGIIYIFQSRLIQDKKRTVGDAMLKPFAGTLKLFDSSESVQHMLTGGSATILNRIRELDIASKMGKYTVKGEFVTNLNIDENGKRYLRAVKQIHFVGKEYLETRYISNDRDIPIHSPATFVLDGQQSITYKSGSVLAVVAPIKASDLIQLAGIADQSLFAPNVRGPLGKTDINKAIVKSIEDKNLHSRFPLFHNGITIVAGKVANDKAAITIEDYFVVNGCQSLTALFENQRHMTDDLRILTKIIQLDRNSALAKTVTNYSNNQNGTKARDFMSNNPVQIRLQNDFRQFYPGTYSFEIKRGEHLEPGIIITNETAGLYLMAFDLKEPWATHRRYNVFGDKHAEIFARPEVTADRIVMCHIVNEAIGYCLPEIENQLCAKYVLTRYALIYCLRLVMEADELTKSLLRSPEGLVRNAKNRERFRDTVRHVISDMVTDLNFELQELGEDFDYREKMRNSQWVQNLARKIVGDHIKMIRRKKIRSIGEEWKEQKPLERNAVG